MFFNLFSDSKFADWNGSFINSACKKWRFFPIRKNNRHSTLLIYCRIRRSPTSFRESAAAGGFGAFECPAADSLYSPLPASPCASVLGSKIFTFPPALFELSRARRPTLFAPRYPLALLPPFRGAKSSHFRRRFWTARAPGGRPSLLPATR